VSCPKREQSGRAERVTLAAKKGIRIVSQSGSDAQRKRAETHARFLRISKRLGAEERFATMIDDYLGGW
jgi:hypothetical protein